MAVEIRPFNWRRHLRAVLEFQREIYETNFPGFAVDRRFLRDYEDQLRRAAESPCEALFVLEEGPQVGGFLWVSLISTMIEPCVGYIKNIFVAPDLRGRGFGRQLLAHGEHWCLGQGVTRVSLDASCCNERAMGLYEGAGYRTVRVRMEKDLL